jgi:Protein of unknown function (DUF3147)
MSTRAARAGSTRIRVEPQRALEAGWRPLALRFAFGATMGLVSGVITLLAGPGVGGVFLASPSTLLASLTLVAKEEGLHSARDECRGATCGAVGMVAFALITAAGIGRLRWPAPVALIVATVGWLVVGGLCYLIMRARIGDEDET